MHRRFAVNFAARLPVACYAELIITVAAVIGEDAVLQNIAARRRIARGDCTDGKFFVVNFVYEVFG